MRNGLFWMSLCWLVACGDEGNQFRIPTEPTGAPVALGEQLVFVRNQDHSAIYLSPESFEDGQTERIELPVGPLQPVLRKGDGEPEALVLCEGRRGDRDDAAVPAALAVIDAEGKQRRYELGNPFHQVHQSSDGRYAILLKNANSGRLLDNPLEIAIVDLDESGEDAVTLRTPRSFGDAPKQVYFSPRMRIGEEDRRLAVVFSEADVTLIDLDHLDRVETTVPLSGSTNRDILPEQVVFDAERAALYVRGSASDDLYVFQLESQISDEGHNDFKPFVNLLPAGQAPRDMALYDLGDGPRLLVVAETSQQAIVVEAGSSRTTPIALEAPADHVLLFEATSPTDSESSQRALLYDQGGTTLMFLDLEDVEEQRTRNLETLSLNFPISRVIALRDEGKVLVLHDAAAVSLLDLADRTVTPISAAQSLTDASFDPERKRLWVAPPNQPWVGYLDLATGETAELLLDAPVESFVALPDAGKFAVVHPSKLGLVTLFDAAEPERDTALSLRGYLVDGFLEVE
jgi:hypothetical protein